MQKNAIRPFAGEFPKPLPRSIAAAVVDQADVDRRMGVEECKQVGAAQPVGLVEARND